MATKTRFADSPRASPLDSHDFGSQHSYVVPTLDTLALVLKQMALINARMNAQSADALAAAAVAAADPLITQRNRDAQLEPSRHEVPVEQLPPLPPDMDSLLPDMPFRA
jgi:hypothetical protein